MCVIIGGDVYDDMAKLTYANITICSASTFCLWPAIANPNQAYFPITKLILDGFTPNLSFTWMNNNSMINGLDAAVMRIEEIIRRLNI